MCLFCTLMFVFSALLVFSNSLEHWGCCWIVRIMVGCWLEITVNGLIMLTKDILRNTKDVAFTFLGEGGGEREKMCVYEWTYTAIPPTLQLEMTASFSPHCSQSNDGFWFAFWGCSQCAWLTRSCKAITLPPWRASHLCRRTSEIGTVFTDTAVAHAASQYLCVAVSQSCCGLVPSFKPALALLWLEN